MKSPPQGPPLAWTLLALVATSKLILQLVAIHQYGYFRDELYYLASTEHLAWGYVDHPPLSIAVLAVIRAVLGDSLLAIRIVPALAGAATVFLTGALAWRLGGGAFVQSLAALCALLAPQYLGTNHFYSMNSLDLLLWTMAIWFLLDALGTARPRAWMALGLTLGLALLNKISAMWLGGGIVLALLLTPYRRVLLTLWPALAALVAALVFLPHVLWQVQEGWPTLEFMRNATALKMTDTPPLDFLREQLLTMNPGTAPIWIVGLLAGLLGLHGPRGRVLAWIYVGVLVLLLVAGRSRASYLAVAYPMLFAMGASSAERVAARARMGWVRPATMTIIILAGLPLVPLALPVLPVETYVRYQETLGLEPDTDERQEMGALPQHFADMFGWEEKAALVARAYERLAPEERSRSRVFGQNYGEAGAIDVLGRKLGLPRALSGHNSYWLWGRDDPDTTWNVLIIIGGDRQDNAEFFGSLEIVGQTRNPWSMPYERGLDVSIGRKPRVSRSEAWPRMRRYI
ncbi:MAG TPA: glycosyltransferase family 39 protein, partial [Candidatus Eisenbacteria bacterium]|nr:glycosyltransferase family 39 protein [Candidatus Eisenbacteria bacterium]